MYFFACYVEFYHPYLQRWIAENLFNRQNFAQLKKGAILSKYLSSDAVDAKYHMSIIVSLLLGVLADIMTESLPIASGNAADTQDTDFV